jgi:hypothetical protein
VPKYVKLTDRLIAAGLQPSPPGKRCEIWDTVCHGLAIRSAPSGRHSYIVCGTVKGLGTATRYTIGKVGVISLTAARAEAVRIKELMALGKPLVTEAAAARAVEREAIEAERAAAKRADAKAKPSGDDDAP